MSLANGRMTLTLGWLFEKAITDFETAKQGSDSISFTTEIDGADYSIRVERVSLAAAATVTHDLSAAFTELAGGTMTPTAIIGMIAKVTGTTAILKIEPGATDPLTWFFGGATQSITVGTGGAFAYYDPDPETITAGSACEIKLTNTGAAAMVAYVGYVVGTP
jgi:hypothetical protein